MRRTAAASDLSREDSTAQSERHDAALELIEGHDAVFRRTARRYSLCADDAEDAYQRALEILLTKAPPIEHDALVRWMQTVTKHEALSVRRQRERILAPIPKTSDGEERDPLDRLASEGPGLTDRAASRERVARSREALRALKPQEVRALGLKAEGFSYAEIGEITGWTYTKINRCMAEGRKRFLEVFSEIEQGRRCERYRDSLSALADGELAEAEAGDLKAHLAGCSTCRAVLAMYRGLPEKVLALTTPVAVQPSAVERVHGWATDQLGALAEKVREGTYGMLGRSPSGDGATQAAALGAGTRGAGMATLGKLLAVCGATAAGGAACVATGVVEVGALGAEESSPPPIQRPARPAEPPPRVPVAPPQPEPPVSRDPTSPATEPAPTPTQQTEQQFGFESGAPSASTGGGGEFGGVGGSSGGGGSGGSGGQFGFEN